MTTILFLATVVLFVLRSAFHVLLCLSQNCSRNPCAATLPVCDALKKANLLDRVVEKIGRKPLKVFVEVNISGETSKFGAQPVLCVDLLKHIVTECPNLEFCGLMTIGMLDYSSTPENFKTLSNCKREVCTSLGLPEEKCELSMGMTTDFERAIEMESTTVRIGTAIFGVLDPETIH
ncbi:hypothetical protein OROGR_007165 [Orobanche gracilis]